ncbi:MAG TPA: DinB family protein [Terriglobales bacterium]|nr:DinB family protein [Terriglobales bacterium]
MPKLQNDAAALRRHLATLLRGDAAHAPLAQSIGGLSLAAAGRKFRTAPYTAWQLLEHIRIAQWDILEFSRDPHHVSPDFPAGYWPATAAPPSAAALRRSRATILADLEAMIALVLNPRRDLFAPLPHAPDKTLLREALALADHNAYHAGQLVLARKLAGDWKS